MATTRVLQIFGLASTLLLLAVSPVLFRLTHSDEGGNTPAFVVSFLVLMGGQMLATVRVPRVYDLLSQIVRNHPIRMGLFSLNLAIVGWFAVNIFARCGLIVVLLGWGGLLIAVSCCSSRHVTDWIKLSPISFATFYLLLFVGEVLLRYNPLLVGGGGGGNPALRQMYAGLYSKNSFGMRGPEFTLAPAPSVFRIVMLGDSFTFGQGVAEGETYPDHVRRLLSRRDAQPQYEVINAGRSGTDTYDQLQRLREQCLEFQPDLVTVQFYLNDLEPRLEATSDAGGFVDNVVMFPAHRSYSIFFLKFRFDRLRNKINKGLLEADPQLEWVARIAGRIGPDHDEWLRFESAVDGFGEISRTRQLPIVFVLLPHPGLEDLSALRNVHQTIRKRVEAAGLQVFDLTDVWSDLEPELQVVSPIDHHPSVAAHERTADCIVQGLDELHLLAEPAN